MEKKTVEAATLQKKKTAVNKGRVKKTIKNTLCRPDPVFWPNVSEDQANTLEAALSMYKVEIPEFKKPHWKVLKDIPKDQRPKQPKIKKVDGLIFGIAQCIEAINLKECSAVIIESTMNPRTLVQPLIEACVSTKVPVLCLNALRKITSINFGIPTSCLAIKNGFLQELYCKIEEIAKLHKTPEPLQIDKKNIENAEQKVEVQDKMELDESTQHLDTQSFTYLYRSSKKSRIFNPSAEKARSKAAFVGQDFIELSDKPEQKKSDNKAYASMILKRITNNQNRLKRK